MLTTTIAAFGLPWEVNWWALPGVVGMMVYLLLLATKDGTSDRESARRTRVDLDWKHALGLDIDHPGIAATTLSLFRARVVLHDADQQLFRATLAGRLRWACSRARSWR